MKREIALIGAFDRNNYGDILMPIVFTRYFEKKYPDLLKKYSFRYYGLKESNMEKYCGYSTEALSNIYANKQIDYAVVVGGDTLPCRYGNMYIHFIEDSKKEKRYQFYDRYFRPCFEKYAKKQLKGREIKPWILDLKEYNIKTIYNTVGGLLTNRKLLFHKNSIKETLNDSTYLSVRDTGTKKYLDKLGVKNELYPDSVIILSECITEDDFNKYVSENIKKTIEEYDNYFVLQISEAASKGEIDNTILEIEKIYNEAGMKCILLPIGRASGHNDQIPLEKIKNGVKTPVFLPNDNNIFETAYIIRNSKFFCGTSLHGIITSISYGIPHMALTNKIGKLIRFINTWNTTPVVYTESNDILNKYYELSNTKELDKYLKDKRNELIKLVEENFKRIYKSINK